MGYNKGYNTNRESNLYKIVHGLTVAASKKRESENKLRAEIYKERVKAKLDEQNQKRQFFMDMLKERVKNQTTNPQKFTPEQEYLRRRAREENPLMAMAVPEAGQEMNGIRYPQAETAMDKKSGVFQTKPIDQARQTQLLQQKVDQMIAQGKTPHPAVMKLLELQRRGQGGKYDPTTGALVPGAGKGAKMDNVDAIQKRLQFMNNPMNEPDDPKQLKQWEKEKADLTQKLNTLTGYGSETSKGAGKGAKKNNDPIVQRIDELRAEYSDEEIAGFLREKNIDPKKYGL